MKGQSVQWEEQVGRKFTLLHIATVSAINNDSVYNIPEPSFNRELCFVPGLK
jgi:hypothetical protein